MTKSQLKQKKILIVEDEKPLVRALSVKLKASGFQIKAAYDGAEAFEALKNDKYDLIVLDLIMPNIDGFSVLEELKQKKIKIPVIVTSNLGQKEDFLRVKKYGTVDYLIKSKVTLGELSKRIISLLQAK